MQKRRRRQVCQCACTPIQSAWVVFLAVALTGVLMFAHPSHLDAQTPAKSDAKPDAKPVPKPVKKTDDSKKDSKKDPKKDYKWIELAHSRGSVGGNSIRTHQEQFEVKPHYEKVRFRWKIKLNGLAGNFFTSIARFNPGPAKFQTTSVICRVRSNQQRSVVTRLAANKYQLEFKYQRVAMDFWVEAWADPDYKPPQDTTDNATTPVSTSEPEIKWDSVYRYSGQATENRTGHTFRYFTIKKKYAKVRFSWLVKRLGAGHNLRVTLAALPPKGRKYQNVSVVCRTRSAGAGASLVKLPPGKYRLEMNYQRLGVEFRVDGQPQVDKTETIDLDTNLK